MKLAPQLISRALRVGRFEFPIEQTQAITHAAANFELNRAALDRVWPRTTLALPESLPELEWLYARDGALSARHVDGQWFGDVSIPRLAARRMLGKLTVSGSTAVLLAPTHAEQLLVALERTSSRQGLIAVIPTEQTAGVIAACADLSVAIAERRLWLACGPDWADELRAIFDGNDGLAPVSTMIRVPGLNGSVLDVIQKPCDAVLAHHAQTHRQLVSMIHGRPRRPAPMPAKLLVVGGDFELWDDASSLLGRACATAAVECVVLDPSRPEHASALRMARLAEPCDAIVTANVGRSDRANPIVPDNVPWVTWQTSSRVPLYSATADRDLLVLADEALRPTALAAGWPSASLRVAAEPIALTAPSAKAGVAIIADYIVPTLPKAVEDMSSHRLAWELAERELRADVLAVHGSPDAFLDACAARVGVPAGSLPRDLFMAQLITPLFATELASQLTRRGLDVRLYGRGWDALPELASAWRGPVATADDFSSALADSVALLDVWPGAITHRSRRCGRPILPAWGRSWHAMASDIRSATSVVSAQRCAEAAFSIDRVANWLGQGVSR